MEQVVTWLPQQGAPAATVTQEGGMWPRLPQL